MKVRERKKAIDSLKKRKLEKPYLKAKNFLESGRLKMVDFKLRKPKSKNIYYTDNEMVFGFLKLKVVGI
ncbi:MAG: hypothetical protein L3J41_00165 [Melioribacteraceae bacterium]|nr:hypothetical protein [Melioribacteraceae bacterium]